MDGSETLKCNEPFFKTEAVPLSSRRLPNCVHTGTWPVGMTNSPFMVTGQEGGQRQKYRYREAARIRTV